MVEKSGIIFSTAWKHLTSLDWTWKELVGDSKIRFGLDIVATSQEQTKPPVQNYI